MARHDRNKPLYMISVAAELAGVHPQTLRIYEAKGIITPSRSAGNTRLYSEADVDRLRLVQRLTTEGINLAGVIRILDLEMRLEESEGQADELRQVVSDIKRELHEMKMREMISAITRMDTTRASRALGTGETAPETSIEDLPDVATGDSIDFEDISVGDEDMDELLTNTNMSGSVFDHGKNNGSVSIDF